MTCAYFKMENEQRTCLSEKHPQQGSWNLSEAYSKDWCTKAYMECPFNPVGHAVVQTSSAKEIEEE